LFESFSSLADFGRDRSIENGLPSEYGTVLEMVGGFSVPVGLLFGGAGVTPGDDGRVSAFWTGVLRVGVFSAHANTLPAANRPPA